MEKMIKPVVEAIDGFLPGYKTHVIILMAIGMSVCQMLGHHEFATETWQVVGLAGGMTWKLGQDRAKK
jgi:hypothetical protein